MASRAPDNPWEEWRELLASETTEPLDVLGALARFQRYFAAIEVEAIKAARARDDTWDEIGRALGTTRQAVWQRYRDITKTTRVNRRTFEVLLEALAAQVNEDQTLRAVKLPAKIPKSQ
ncbi:MAG: hypothetical protein ACYCZV_16865 [Acidimicrobiales bacterium]